MQNHLFDIFLTSIPIHFQYDNKMSLGFGQKVRIEKMINLVFIKNSHNQNLKEI